MAELKDVLHDIVRHLTVRQEAKDELHQAIDALVERKPVSEAKKAG